MDAQTTGGVSATFGWDDAARLETWSRGTDSASYTYEGNGQRTSATVTVGGTTTTTDYNYDGLTLLSLDAERSDETTFSVAYLTGEDGRPYAGVYASSETSVPVTFLVATTDRGDVVALTDTAGAVFARYTYDPYGRVLSQDANAVSGITSNVASAIRDRQPLRYAGYTYDAHSATYYLSQRHYDPATMRFLIKDPARDDGEESAYQYCAGDPVGKVDSTGLRTIVRSQLWKLTISNVSYKTSIDYVTSAVLSAFGLRLPGPAPGTMGVPGWWLVRVTMSYKVDAQYRLMKNGTCWGWRGVVKSRSTSYSSIAPGSRSEAILRVKKLTYDYAHTQSAVLARTVWSWVVF
jgi:RHS repeat-associated protein